MNRVGCKVVLLGESEAGKTSLLQKYIHNIFDNTRLYRNTMGAAFVAKEVEADGKTITLDIWDTAGSERLYYRNAKAAIVCYDITDRISFKRAKTWIQELKSYEENCKIYLCATKKDLIDYDLQKPPEHEPSLELDIVQRYADMIGSKFFITSSKTGENVAQVFREIANDYVPDPANIINKETISASVLPKKKGGCCC